MWATIGIIIDLLILVGIIFSFSYNVLLGIVLLVMWFFGGFPFMFGVILSEFDEKNSPQDTTSESGDNPLSVLLHNSGVTVSSLRPSGSVEIDGKRYVARSQLGLIDPGTPIKVADIQHGVLIVDKI